MDQVEMPLYRCHKEVRALKIADGVHEVLPNGDVRLAIADGGFAPVTVKKEVVSRHFPMGGDYLVVYRDGYQSISPGKEFEDGYARITASLAETHWTPDAAELEALNAGAAVRVVRGRHGPHRAVCHVSSPET